MTSKDKKSQPNDSDIIESRVSQKIRDISPYSVPHFNCKVRLDGNESPFSLPKEVQEKVDRAIKEIDINRYPDPEAKRLIEIISGVCEFPKEGILLGNGSDELIGMLITTFSNGTGRVLCPTPTFSMYRLAGLAMGADIIETALDENFDIDLDETISMIENNDPDLIFLASPNNPTGNMYSADKIAEIISVAKGIVVVDEAYSDFSGYTFLPLVKECENLVILRTLSKVGFAGLRIGKLFARDNLVNEINKVRYPYNINSLSQVVAEIVLENHEFVTENIQLIIRERDRIYKALSSLEQIEAYPSDANFIFFRVDDADSIFSKLVEKDILIRNFNRPGRLSGCMRVTIGTPEENDAFLSALGEIFTS
ncbi:MAG: histidinol-phosphate transaminase [Thermodesulfobacteriota bacterium]